MGGRGNGGTLLVQGGDGRGALKSRGDAPAIARGGVGDGALPFSPPRCHGNESSFANPPDPVPAPAPWCPGPAWIPRPAFALALVTSEKTSAWCRGTGGAGDAPRGGGAGEVERMFGDDLRPLRAANVMGACGGGSAAD